MTKALVDPWIVHEKKWRGGWPSYWTAKREQLSERKRKAYNRWRRHGYIEAWDEQDHQAGALNRATKRERRRQQKENKEILLRAPLGTKAQAMAADRRGRERWKGIEKRKGDNFRQKN